jgi:hypothetical protein
MRIASDNAIHNISIPAKSALQRQIRAFSKEVDAGSPEENALGE